MFSVYLKNKHILRSSYFFIILNETKRDFKSPTPSPLLRKRASHYKVMFQQTAPRGGPKPGFLTWYRVSV